MDQTLWPRAGIGNIMASAGGMRLKWRKEYESGDAHIDAQHRALWGYANQLADLIDAARPRDEVAEVVLTILREIEQHFATEEEALRRSGYGETSRHAKLHSELLAQARALVESLEDGSEPSYFCDFLVFGLIVGHILGEDRKYFGRLLPAAS